MLREERGCCGGGGWGVGVVLGVFHRSGLGTVGSVGVVFFFNVFSRGLWENPPQYSNIAQMWPATIF